MFHKTATLVAALAAIFPGNLSWGQNGEPGVITGTVTYLQRIALPPDAVVSVQLQDLSFPSRGTSRIAPRWKAAARKK